GPVAWGLLLEDRHGDLVDREAIRAAEVDDAAPGRRAEAKLHVRQPGERFRAEHGLDGETVDGPSNLPAFGASALRLPIRPVRFLQAFASAWLACRERIVPSAAMPGNDSPGASSGV